MDVLNGHLLAGAVSNELGQVLTSPLEGLLVNADQSLGFPVRDGIPDMVEGDALVLVNFKPFPIRDISNHS